MRDEMLSQHHLKQILRYIPETGLFVNRKGRKHAKPGSVVGSFNASGYLVAYINRRAYLLHRLAFLYMEGKIPEHFVDHINRKRDDNRWCNLRHATPSINNKNKGAIKSNPLNITPTQIKQARLDAELTQREASELVSISIKTWQAYEGGWRNIRPATWRLFNLLTEPRT